MSYFCSFPGWYHTIVIMDYGGARYLYFQREDGPSLDDYIKALRVVDIMEPNDKPYFVSAYHVQDGRLVPGLPGTNGAH